MSKKSAFPSLDKSKTFQYDTNSEVTGCLPDISQLLKNQKNLPHPPPSEQPPTEPPKWIQPTLTSTAVTIPQQVKSSPLKKKSDSIPPLPVLEVPTLKTKSDKISQSLNEWIQQGARNLLLLTLSSTPSQGFQSTLCVNPEKKLILWTGLTWNPQQTHPEIWMNLTKSQKILHCTTANIRTLFGIQQSESLNLILIEQTPLNACSILIVIL